MDVFALREGIVGEHRDYFESFVCILDDRIATYVQERPAPVSYGLTLSCN